MKIHFKVHFITQWGEFIRLIIKHKDSEEVHTLTYEMVSDRHFVWHAELDVDTYPSDSEYYYCLEDTKGKLHREYGQARPFPPISSNSNVYFSDTWRQSAGQFPFESVVFKDCYFRRENLAAPALSENTLSLRLYAPVIEPDRHFSIIGNQPCLGEWDIQKKLNLEHGPWPFWSIQIPKQHIQWPLEFKFLIVETKTDDVLAWGGGPNRKINSLSHEGIHVVTEEHFIRTIPSWKAAGVAIPVFSLRSKKSFGVGEFNDLKLMVDWAVSTGQKMIQILPINDTILYHSNYDSYPYNAVSVYALHPIYLHLDAIGKLKSKERRSYFSTRQRELNAKSFADYQNVMQVKWEYFREIYSETAAKVFATLDYQQFFEANKEWLVPYAVFSYLRDKFGTPEFGKWPQYQHYNEDDVAPLRNDEYENANEIKLFYFLQYHLNKQLHEVHQYALDKGVCIKGDIPIGVSPRSVDAWVEPQLFNTQMQAGAPPDDFSVTGQNWGFPTYQWDVMQNDNYHWWKKRFQKLAEYFDAYRIDHILGFFRIWEIPQTEVWGLTGIFNPALPYTIQELEEKGIKWDENRFTKPYLKEHVLQSVFGKYTQDVIREYFDKESHLTYKFKPKFDTQKKVEAYFASLGYNFGTKEVLVRDGLYLLHSEVLFIRDPKNPDRFHPRIAIHSAASFRDLPEDLRRNLDAIYVDFYYCRHNEFWKKQALKKLPALIQSTGMLVCGEDLGMVPDSVPQVMQQLEILSLEIQRMPKKPSHEFAMPQDAPYLSVCTSSTHDMNPIRAWWLEDRNVTQRFYNRALGIQGTAPEHCEPWIAERIIHQHLHSPAMWVILPWQDWMAIDGKHCLENPTAERINVPSNPRNFWCYRMHLHLEDLLKLDAFNLKIKQLIEESGR